MKVPKPKTHGTLENEEYEKSLQITPMKLITWLKLFLIEKGK